MSADCHLLAHANVGCLLNADDASFPFKRVSGGGRSECWGMHVVVSAFYGFYSTKIFINF